MISQKTPSGKSVFNIICGEKFEEYSGDAQEEVPEEAALGSTDGSPAEEAPLGNTGEAAPEEKPQDFKAPEELPDFENVFIVNRGESYILTNGKWIDLTSKEAGNIILQKGEKDVANYNV